MASHSSPSSTSFNIEEIAQNFHIPGQFIKATTYGNGHINDTYAATYQHHGQETTYIHQRINHHVFKNPLGVMQNVERITAHLQKKLATLADGGSRREALQLLPTHAEKYYHEDERGNIWRTYKFIQNAKSFEVLESPAHAYEAGKAFGHFQQMLVDIPGPRLVETIPGFHHTPQRFLALQQALEADTHNRAKTAQAEINFALQNEALAHTLLKLHEQGQIPERVTHNDTKINNVLLDSETGAWVCVIDLDTVMPGLALYDFGDMVRTATCLAAEDEPDLNKVKLEVPFFEALTEGYLSQASQFLNSVEKDHLVFSGKLITFEIGIRFLTDYLQGDTYFKIHRPEHNLDRCRTQFKLIESIMAQEDDLRQIVKKFS